MESRPCHFGDSRVHKLKCGHYIAIEGKADSCAENCVGLLGFGILNSTDKEAFQKVSIDLLPIIGRRLRLQEIRLSQEQVGWDPRSFRMP
jgi:hypothetical protein